MRACVCVAAAVALASPAQGRQPAATPALALAQAEPPPSLPLPAPVAPPQPTGPVPPAPDGGPPPKAPGVERARLPAAPTAAAGIPALARTVFMRGLQRPQDLAFAPDGALFFTERERGLSVRKPDGSVARLFTAQAIGGQAAATLGVTVDPQFARNRFVYVFLCAPGEVRVVRLKLDATGGLVVERADILTVAAPSAPAGAAAHAGGALRFGPDGALYVGIGDLLDANAPQSPASLPGKVLRIDRDGRAASGHRAPAGFDARVFAYGLRAPTALAFAPPSAEVYVGEDGAGRDEITLLGAGGNGGWDPRCAALGVASAPGGYCGRTSADARQPLAPMTDLARFPAATPPLWTNLNRAQGLAAMAFLRGARWRAWDGALAVAYAGGRRIDVLRLSAGGGVDDYAQMLGTLEEPVRALALGPDGALYVGTDGKRDGDEIWRVEAR